MKYIIELSNDFVNCSIKNDNLGEFIQRIPKDSETKFDIYVQDALQFKLVRNLINFDNRVNIILEDNTNKNIESLEINESEDTIYIYLTNPWKINTWDLKSSKNNTGVIYKLEDEIAVKIAKIKASSKSLLMDNIKDVHFFENKLNLPLISSNFDCIKKMKKHLKIEELELFLERLVKLDDKFFLEYVMYLYEIGKIEKVLDLLNSIDIVSAYNNGYYYDENVNAQEFINSITTINGKTTFVYNDDRSNQMLKLIGIEYEDELIREYVNKNLKAVLFLPEGYSWITYGMQSFILKKISKYKLINPFVLYLISNALLRYEPFFNAYALTIVIDYIERYMPETLSFKTNEYSPGNVPNYRLKESLINEEYQEGLKEYNEKFYNLHKISIKNDDYNYPLFDEKPKHNRVALCLSGVCRGDVIAQLESQYNNIILPFEKKGIEVDVYLFTWDNHDIYPGAGWRRKDNERWYYKCFPSVNDFVPKELEFTKGLKELFPKTANVFLNPISQKLNKESIMKIFPNIEVQTQTQKEFEEDFGNIDGLITDGNLIQAKMFYGIYKAVKMCEDSKKDYDFIIRNRIDYPLYYDLNVDKIYDLKSDELAVAKSYNFGVIDGMYIGMPKVITTVSKVWEFSLREKFITPLLHDGKQLTRHAEDLVFDWVVLNKIFLTHKVNFYPNYDATTANVQLPDYREELKDDLDKLDITKEEQEKYEEFFKFFETSIVDGIKNI